MKSTQLLFLLFISVVAWAGGPAKSNFTAMEVNHIRVNTPGLFNERKSFSIHLDSPGCTCAARRTTWLSTPCTTA